MRSLDALFACGTRTAISRPANKRRWHPSGLTSLLTIRGKMKMQINNLKLLDEARQAVEEMSRAIVQRFEDDIVYFEEKSEDGTYKRPLIVIQDIHKATEVRNAIKEIEQINEAIMEFTGKSSTQLNRPTYMDDVVFARVYENTSVSSRTSTTSRADIVARLEAALKIALKCQLAETETNMNRMAQLEKELEWFKNDTEENYRLRSFGTPDSISHIYTADDQKHRIRITMGGLFLLTHNQEPIRINKPEHRLPRKKRASIFDDLQPIPYSATYHGLLYRESEVIHQKERIGYSQAKVDEKMKKKQKVRKK